ncbi:amidohydrolase family protein [Zwartia sp.]|uniref:N-acyl-D-amino-acid deacylase family protein n=1 Tax=Zwartia sp. TaxID=2978004 RepID=UPI002719157B|nr:amidohydrolase family protein [Zwartia sp.]MDO9025041.1 amidohydrolase family protein [Zwartia sp.]
MATLIIRNGTIVDGTGAKPFIGDIKVVDGLIKEVGQVSGTAEQEIDAKGLLVTPGFVDIHTHYDGQVTWSNKVASSSQLGVTTVVMGNCGVGFAPCKQEHREITMKLMEGVEDIPGVVLDEGLPWNWTSFPEYLDSLEARQFDIDVAAQIGHAPLRINVMGERGAKREPSTDEDRAKMTALAVEAVKAGALGFTTSRTILHRSSDGQPTPTLGAAEGELTAIAKGLGEAGIGVLQLVTDFDDVDEEFAMLRRIVEASGRPLSLTLLQHEHLPQRWRRVMEHMHAATDAGLQMKAQVGARPVALILSFALSLCPFTQLPSFEALRSLSPEERLNKLRDPAVRAKILSEEHTEAMYKRRVANFENLYPLGDPPDYEPRPEDSIAARAERAGIDPAAFAYDYLLENDGTAMLYRPLYNYADRDHEVLREMLMDRDTVPGLSDGGAHYGFICDASFPTYLLTHWARDRSRGEKIPLELLVKWQTQDTAATVGLNDRGILRPGYKADINLIDFEGLKLHAPKIVYDLPAGGRRLGQAAEGFRATIVSGVVTYKDGTPTGQLPGKLIRGAQQAPAAA